MNLSRQPTPSFRRRPLVAAILVGLSLLSVSGCVTTAIQTAQTTLAGGGLPKPASTEPKAGPGIPADLRPLFQKGKVTGAELYGTLAQIRKEIHDKRSARAWTQANFLADTAADKLMTGNLGVGAVFEAGRNAAVDVATNELRSRATVIAYQALDDHMSTLLGTKLTEALAAETVTLPSGAEMTPAQAKRTVTMATMVIAARLTGRVLEEAEKDFKSLEVDYKSLLDQREKAAELLFRTVDKRRAAQRSSDAAGRRAAEADMRRTLSEADLRFIDSALNTMTLTEFTNDMAAQNLALQYLRIQDPKAFESYSTKKDDVVRRTQGYLRTVSGVAAFAALSANFVQSVAEVAKEKNIANIVDTAPMIVEFGAVALPIVRKAGSVALQGVGFPSFLQRRNLFVVTTADNQSKDVSGTKEVFEAIKSSGATDIFSSILFRDDALGWLNGVRRCDAAEAGRMLDATVPRDDRSKFAGDYFGDGAKGFAGDYAFVNAFTDPRLGDRERRLPDDLLGRDHRKRFVGLGGEYLAAVQSKVGERYGEWSNQQLLRLIFSNREGAARYATMDLGRVAIRPTPSPEAVFVYESYINSCVAGSNPRTTPPPPAPRPPATTPPARRPAT